MMHCKHFNERLEFGMESVSKVSHRFIVGDHEDIIPCRVAQVDLGLDVVDPGLAPDGANCGYGRVGVVWDGRVGVVWCVTMAEWVWCGMASRVWYCRVCDYSGMGVLWYVVYQAGCGVVCGYRWMWCSIW